MIALHHVQVSCPPGGEDACRRFYAEGLGLTEVEKPEALLGRGGAWFRAYDALGGVSAELHVGVEDPCVPARKAHPAFVVDDLSATVERLRRVGAVVDLTEHESFTGYLRLHTHDPHGHRVEVLQPRSRPPRGTAPTSRRA
jgi:catechol 2,3-dioxygenase-like lactoylglutathione lyase family enzyme